MKKLFNRQSHSFHLVNPSPWPIFTAFALLFVPFSSVMYMHGYNVSLYRLYFGFFFLLFLMFSWWQDVVREATYEGRHTTSVQQGIKIGMLLFIVSEIMFFFAFFWAFFHCSLNPSPAIGGVWPPIYITTLDPWKVPLLNTILLLSSGASVTWTHHAIVYGSKSNAIISLLITIILATIFTLFQVFEYQTAPFNISDGIYGSTFYMATGFHGLHVVIGTIFLFVCLVRLYLNHFTKQQHVGFECAVWYWHFVDVVWIFLFLTIYWWGS
jgi:cytochrome c oxidase subunit 3